MKPVLQLVLCMGLLPAHAADPDHLWMFNEAIGTLPAATANTGILASGGAPTFSNPSLGGYATDGNGNLLINGVDYGLTVNQSLAQLGTSTTGTVWFRWDVSWDITTPALSGQNREVYLIHRDAGGSNRFRWTLDLSTTGTKLNVDGNGFAAISNFASGLGTGASASLITGFTWNQTNSQVTAVEAHYALNGGNFTPLSLGTFTPFNVSNLGDIRLHAKGSFANPGDVVRVDRIIAGPDAASVGLGPPPPPPPVPEPKPDPAPSPVIVLDGSGFSPGDPADMALGPAGEALAQTSTTLRVGSNSNSPAGGRNTLLVFPMPVLPAGSTLSAARLSVTASAFGNPSFHGDVWGVAIQNSPTPQASYFAADTGDPSAVKLDDDFLKPSLSRPQRVTTRSDSVMASWLAAFYQQNPSYNGGSYAVLRINPDADPGSGDMGYTVNSADFSSSIERPVLYLVLDGTEPAQRPNIIVMVTDDQRWDASGHMQQILAADGKEARFPWLAGHTPGLDRLATEGVRFANAFVTLSLCSPSRTCMLTGKYPHMTGVTDNLTFFPTGSVSYATLLRDSGYATGYFGKWHHANQTDRPGFDTTGTFVNQGNFAGELSTRTNDFLVNGTVVNRSEWVEDVSTGYCLDFINTQAAAGQPFMAFLGFKTPHSGEPFASSSEGSTTSGSRIPRNSAQNALFNNFSPVTAISQNFKPPFRPDANSGTSVVDARNYMETLVGVDDNVVTILNRLDHLGIADNTVVIFTSDNGYFLGEHSLGDKRAAYEESLRVPFLLRYPAQQAAAGVVRHEMTLNLDLAQTLLDFAGIPAPPDMQGRSLMPLVGIAAGDAPAWRSSFLYEYARDPAFPTAIPVITALRRADGGKIVIYPVNPGWTEVFDTAADPYEINNLASSPGHQEYQRQLREELMQAARQVNLLNIETASFHPPTVALFDLTCGQRFAFRLDRSEDLQTWSEETRFNGNGVPSTLTLDAPLPRAFYRYQIIDDSP